MTDNSQDVAKQFMDLWQKQIDSVMRDEGGMSAMMQSMAQMQQQFMNNGGNDCARGFASNFTNDPAPNAADNVDSPKHGDGELLQLQQRIAECEKRISGLERQLKDRG